MEDGPGQLVAVRVMRERDGGVRLPAGAGSGAAATPATGGLPREGSGQAAAPQRRLAPPIPPRLRRYHPPDSRFPAMTHAARDRRYDLGPEAPARRRRALETVKKVVTVQGLVLQEPGLYR